MKTEIKTKRLTLCPMSDAEIEALIERTPSDELRAAYGEMLSGGKSDPGNRVWYAPWSMVLKDAQEYVGDLGFKGPVKSMLWRSGTVFCRSTRGWAIPPKRCRP